MLEEKTVAALKWIIGILNSHSIPYQISGGFAAKLYGSKRKLNDIDIDIPEKSFETILDEVRDYIVDGPRQYVDGKWDLYLMTLDYKGQEIDISGAYEAKISNKERTTWISLPINLSNVVKIDVSGIEVAVMPPEQMIAYKSELDGEHQLEDIEAMQNYIADR